MKIKSVKYLSDYTLLITYENAGEVEVDLYNYIKKSKQPMTRRFLDVKLFKQFQLINSGGITWLGELDLDAEWLYEYALQNHVATV
jgi:Protein of unknown function (DUF2442)